ncbi:hypothetical protein VKT23_016922 [Stygiomarasmius scandens]|uniref:Uncharacterized protein n=1 Tax=Marasmiellus scandens TaxID=2682957 RepID=A0ABR1IVR9_9AGAR
MTAGVIQVRLQWAMFSSMHVSAHPPLFSKGKKWTKEWQLSVVLSWLATIRLCVFSSQTQSVNQCPSLQPFSFSLPSPLPPRPHTLPSSQRPLRGPFDPISDQLNGQPSSAYLPLSESSQQFNNSLKSSTHITPNSGALQ